jgi:phosphoribosyl-ATP pyrophosphohydrolase/phosphoribosyl-AMP cyclohydrolase
MNVPVFFNKYTDGLVPAIIQDVQTHKVLMLGFMNEEALALTLATKKVTFFSRSKNRIWVKGEESGNILEFIEYKVDCDHDTILIKAKPTGPVCHTGSPTCWGEANDSIESFLPFLETVIESRKQLPPDQSYVSDLFNKGLNRIAQKVGEEAVELVIESKEQNTDKFLEEAADLLFHYLLLLNTKGFRLADIENLLRKRHRP